jgi:hypothetical protein
MVMNAVTTPEVPRLDQARASELVSDLGFVLVHAPDDDGSPCSHLVVAFREIPAKTHFDPERMTFWRIAPDDIEGAELDRKRLPEQPVAVSWGAIRVVDRLGVSNAFLTFGGVARAFPADGGAAIVVVDSAAPILRWQGHSQEADPLAVEAAVFFARLRLPVTVEPSVELRIARIDPVALYAAFVADLRARYQAAPALAAMHPGTSEWLYHEARRLEQLVPDRWNDGQGLRRELGWAT